MEGEVTQTSVATGAESESISVSDALELAKTVIKGMPRLVVRGEVSGYRGPNNRSGHCYFSLKDDTGSMDVVIWRGVFERLDVQLQEGLEVVVTGKFDMYVPRGSTSFHIERLEVAGEGLLHQQVERLKKKLAAEGLMDPQRKLPVPAFCTRVGVVTSLSGSVIDDVKRTLARRNPLVELVCCGCSVQGKEAPASITAALTRMAQEPVDAILLVRGGGSLEDLMCFNDESVARVIAACHIPIVTGIGHEPDVTIADLVGDRRCSTPTHAAESIAPSISELIKLTDTREQRLAAAMTSKVTEVADSLSVMGEGLVRASRTTVDKSQATVSALAAHRCLTSPDGFLRDRAETLEMTAERLLEAGPRAITRHARDLDVRARSLEVAASRICPPRSQEVARMAATLDALSPLKVLGRGYAIPRDDKGHVVRGVGDVVAGQRLDVRVSDGTITTTVTDTQATGRE